ncbi:MAG: Dabb family protein [Gaiellaceae bacterium]
MTGCRHVVTLVFRADATDEQIAAVTDALGALPAQIPEIVEYRFGPDLGISDGNHQFAIVADFDSIDGYLAYRDHPAHQAVLADRIRPILEVRAAVQYGI